MHTKSKMANLKVRDHLGDPDVDERIILRHLTEVGCEGVDYIHLKSG
jgi:hypothetical protein